MLAYDLSINKMWSYVLAFTHISQSNDFLNLLLFVQWYCFNVFLCKQQKISSRASSEAAVATTLREIELWFAGARFTIIYHKDTAKRSVPIVKDYKDILSKVSCILQNFLKSRQPNQFKIFKMSMMSKSLVECDWMPVTAFRLLKLYKTNETFTFILTYTHVHAHTQTY